MKQSVRMRKCGTLLVLSGLLFSGCSLRRLALRSTVDLLGKGVEANYEESDLALAEESMAGQLKLLEILLKNDGANPDLLLFASQGFGAYAFFFLEERDAARAAAFYERGRDYGLRRLGKRCGADLLSLAAPEELERSLAKLKRKDVPILFWTAYAWGGLANLSRNDPEILAALPKIERMMLRANELLPGYFYGGADVFLGAYYASRPKLLGGDPEKAKFYFKRALTVSDGKFLTAPLLYARHYAVQVQDRELFKTLLARVADFPLESFPEQRLSNAVAKQRAQKLLEKIDEYF